MPTKHEKEVIKQGIDETTAYYQNKYEESKRKKRPTDPARPSLIKRFAGILLDMVTIAAVGFALQTLFYHTLYYPMGYHEDKSIVSTMNTESHLFVASETGALVQISDNYDSDKTPEENYDVPITYYYSNDARAIENNKMEEYNTAKSNSYLFTLKDGVYVRSSAASEGAVKTFYENCYTEAVEFYKSDPVYIQHVNHSMLVTIGCLMINAVITSAVFYLVIPLIDKKHRTVGMMATLEILVTMDKKPSTKSQVISRYIAVLIMNFLVPIGIYILYPALTGVIWLVNAAVTCFTPQFESLQGYFSGTKVINKTFSSPQAAMDQIVEMAEQERKNHPESYSQDESETK